MCCIRKAEYNISNEKTASQLTVLNQDFRKQNPAHINTPVEFAHLLADACIEFVLASLEPAGKSTNGIPRTYKLVSHFLLICRYLFRQIYYPNTFFRNLRESM